jgi:hypothetical protein
MGSVWHMVIALALQGGVGYFTGDWVSGGVAGAAIFIGREHAQAEYRWIERYGLRHRANMPFWGGFDPRVWSRKSLLDWALPLAVVSAVAILRVP